MSMNLRRGGVAAALAGLALLAAVPAAQAAGCTPQPASDHPFAQWGDGGIYTLVGGGDFEGAMSAWTLTGSADVVEGNDPFLAGGHSVALAAGDSVTTAPICIDDSYPWFRFFARNTAGGKSKLKIEILYTDLKGKARSENTDGYATTGDGWTPSDQIGIPVDFDHAGSTVRVAFRFTAQSNSSLELDDVYVDPMARG